MSKSKAEKEAEFLDGLTQTICDARAEYIQNYQDSWLAGKITTGPDEFLALRANNYMVNHALDQTNVSGGGHFKLPAKSLPTSIVDKKIKTFWIRSAEILQDYNISLPGNREMIRRLCQNTYNFIGSLHNDDYEE